VNQADAIALGQSTLQAVAMISGPVMLGALVVGLAVSILQAVTQVHEITLVFVPKIIAVFLVLMLMGAWMLDQAVSFGTASFRSIEDVGD